ncbi:unnamed protein product [Phytophthora fragariaefolia]|uniref:Unnamed protein product n=1 Tax=Phytophthora fragariaefolia TaxID=1490495 RepID=A0A9W6TLA6_9STRA|nr:unnamed protein product [Phytophthora fragariaefolia]
MWEQLAVKYNGSRTRNPPERDLDSLRRKFKSLYAKPKPTGRGEVPLRLRPVVWAQEIQLKIEEACGVQTSHDGLDEGEDDSALRSLVADVLGDEKAENGSASSHPDSEGVTFEPKARTSNPDSDAESPPLTTTASPVAPDSVSQYAQSTDPIAPDSQGAGAIVTSSGVVDVRLASHFSFSDDDEAVDAETQPPGDRESLSSTPPAHQPGSGYEDPVTVTEHSAATANSRPSSSDSCSSGLTHAANTPWVSRDSRSTAEEQPQSVRRMPQPPPPPTPRSCATPARFVGRPPKQARQHVATVATPDGPVLRRNPVRAAADEREEKENRSLHVTSNRLGGQDLRVLQDNVDALTQSLLNDNGKRSPTPINNTDGPAGAPSYAARKRIRMQQRLDEMQRELDEAESKHSGGTGEMMKLLVFCQKDSERRAENEERRRRSEREERAEADRKERAERELIRREEAKTSERRRLQDLQIARELREEQRRLDAERDAKLEREKEENRRKAEERRALERSEARQRHEQIMLMLSSLQKKRETARTVREANVVLPLLV